METTLIILKPDAVQRGLMGRIISRFEDKGLQVVGCKFMKISPQLAATHYEAHKGKGFYDGLVRFMTSSPVLVLAVRGVGATAGVNWVHELPSHSQVSASMPLPSSPPNSTMRPRARSVA